jgi:hypothetical protein
MQNPQNQDGKDALGRTDLPKVHGGDAKAEAETMIAGYDPELRTYHITLKAGDTALLRENLGYRLKGNGVDYVLVKRRMPRLLPRIEFFTIDEMEAMQ